MGKHFVAEGDLHSALGRLVIAVVAEAHQTRIDVPDGGVEFTEGRFCGKALAR
jgi:hypothetical protein